MSTLHDTVRLYNWRKFALAEYFLVAGISHTQLCAFMSTVSKYSRHVHAHLQPHLYDAAARSLERLPAVLRSHATRFPAGHLGRHQ